MRSIIGIAGGKSKHLRWLGPFTHRDRGLEYREPFCGSAIVALNVAESAPDRCVWINDKDVGHWAIFTAIKYFRPQLKQWVAWLPPTPETFFMCRAFFKANPPRPTDPWQIARMAVFKIALHKFSHARMGGLSSLFGGVSQVLDKTEYRWKVARLCHRIDEIYPVLKHVRITNDDFARLILDQRRRAFIYLDPPYREGSYRLYRHQFSWADHVRLRDMLRVTDHEWLLSYDDHPDIWELYGGWANIAVVQVSHSLSGHHYADELLISNRALAI